MAEPSRLELLADNLGIGPEELRRLISGMIAEREPDRDSAPTSVREGDGLARSAIPSHGKPTRAGAQYA